MTDLNETNFAPPNWRGALMSSPEGAKTDAGRRLLWFMDDQVGGIRIRSFDARLTRRIVEEMVPRIEAEAAAEAVARYIAEGER